MARKPIRPKDIQNPERILSNLINDYVEGNLDGTVVLYKAYVVAVDYDGGKLEEYPLPNPRNSIKARIITGGLDKYIPDENLPVFWPIFSHDVMPIKETEYVYVLFEDTIEQTHGLWFCRIPEPDKVSTPNLTPGKKRYEENPDNDFGELPPDQAIQDTDEPPTTVEISDNFVTEEIPLFKPRVGDRVIEGSNNTIIVLGRDRPDKDDSGEKETAGTVDIVAGRTAPDDMNMADDMSRIYVTMKSDIDKNMATDSIESGVGPVAAIGIKSDEIRIVARKGMKLVVEGGDIFIEAANIHLGPDSSGEAVVLGDSWKTYFEKFLNAWAATHTHTCAVGPSSPPVKPPDPFDQATLSKTVKVKK